MGMPMGGAEHHGSGSLSAETAARGDHCVLWLPRGGAAPEVLVGALKRREVAIWACDDPFMALAHACRLQRRVGAGVAGSNLFICCDPARQTGLAEMVQSLRLYAPRLGQWWFEQGASPNLRPLLSEDLERWTTIQAPIPANVPAQPAQPPAAKAQPTVHTGTNGGAGKPQLVPTTNAGKSAGLWNRVPMGEMNSGAMLGEPTPTSKPALRLVGDQAKPTPQATGASAPGGSGANGSGSAGAAPGRQPAEVLTPDELAMLLGPLRETPSKGRKEPG
jgi:hypothetical protein